MNVCGSVTSIIAQTLLLVSYRYPHSFIEDVTVTPNDNACIERLRYLQFLQLYRIYDRIPDIGLNGVFSHDSQHFDYTQYFTPCLMKTCGKGLKTSLT